MLFLEEMVQEVGMEGAVAPGLNSKKELRAAPFFYPKPITPPTRGHTGQAWGWGAGGIDVALPQPCFVTRIRHLPLGLWGHRSEILEGS